MNVLTNVYKGILCLVFKHRLTIAGERYDVIIQATAPPGDYWIKIQGYDDCLPNANGAAILHYEGYNGDPKFTPAEDPQNFTEREMVGVFVRPNV